MKKIQILFLSLIFFFWSFQEIFANECENSSIKNYFSWEDLTDEYLNSKRIFFTENLSKEKDFQLNSIEEMNNRFINSQDEKFSFSIQYVLKVFEEKQEEWNNWDWEDWSKKILEKFEKWNENYDFFINKFLKEKEKNEEDVKNIPTSVLQNSVYLDFLIFSCEFWNYWVWTDFSVWIQISEILSDSETDDFDKKEILEKQKIVVWKVMWKYQSFLNNREIYISLRWVIEKLEHLKWRFEDLARLIWFLPSKLVDFWYNK